MNKIIVIAIVLIVGWYGNLLYKKNNSPFMNSSETNFDSDKQVKCITKDGRVLYGSVPQGTNCERLEPVKGSITIVPGQTSISNKDSNHRASSFKCDGRQHCSQMKSRAEAEFFVRNCPNTKMDGDHDGVPCENDSRF